MKNIIKSIITIISVIFIIGFTSCNNPELNPELFKYSVDKSNYNYGKIHLNYNGITITFDESFSDTTIFAYTGDTVIIEEDMQRTIYRNIYCKTSTIVKDRDYYKRESFYNQIKIDYEDYYNTVILTEEHISISIYGVEEILSSKKMYIPYKKALKIFATSPTTRAYITTPL